MSAAVMFLWGRILSELYANYIMKVGKKLYIMKKNFSLFAVAIMACFISMNAQNRKAPNLIVGFSPFGTTSTSIKLDDEKYKYDYKSYWNVNVGFEKELLKELLCIIYCTELTYAHASFDKYDLKGTNDWFNPQQDDDMNQFSIATYVGTKIFPKSRLQLPIYVGVGTDYIKSGKAVDAVCIDLAAKTRLKFFVTDKICLFVGANAKWGFGQTNYSNDKGKKSKDYSTHHNIYNIEAGISIGLGKTK